MVAVVETTEEDTEEDTGEDTEEDMGEDTGEDTEEEEDTGEVDMAAEDLEVVAAVVEVAFSAKSRKK